MDTNSFGFDDIPQVVEATKAVFSAAVQIATAITTFVTALGLLIAGIGRFRHAKQTGNSVASALVSGSNTPVGLTQTVSAQSTAIRTGDTTVLPNPASTPTTFPTVPNP